MSYQRSAHTLLVVDRSKNPSGGMVVIARDKGEWLVRQLITHIKRKYLTTGKEEDEPLEINKTTGILDMGSSHLELLPANGG